MPPSEQHTIDKYMENAMPNTAEPTNPTEQFEAYRPLMFGIAYRMLGSATEAEDVVQDAFRRALEVWSFRGVPENPSAWLMATAKNRALDVLRRERTARTFAPELTRLLQSEWTLAPTIEEQFQEHAIKDDVLRMMFSCCHRRLLWL